MTHRKPDSLRSMRWFSSDSLRSFGEYRSYIRVWIFAICAAINETLLKEYTSLFDLRSNLCHQTEYNEYTIQSHSRCQTRHIF